MALIIIIILPEFEQGQQTIIILLESKLNLE